MDKDFLKCAQRVKIPTNRDERWGVVGLILIDILI
jgi:hypothetical protein